MPAEMSYEEQMAQGIVARALGCEVTQWDTGRQSSMYDFNIGDSGALEVTTLVDRETMQALSRAAKNSSVRARALRTSWVVMMNLPQDDNERVLLADFRNDIVPKIKNALLTLEAQGVTEMSKWKDLRQHYFCRELCGEYCPVRALVVCGVWSAWQAPQLDAKHGEPRIELATAHRGSVSPDPNVVVDVIERTLETKRDNWEKLQVSGKNQREIFFWSASTERHTHRLLQEDRLPDRAPKIERYGLTRIWVGAIGHWDTALHWTHEFGWRRYPNHGQHAD